MVDTGHSLTTSVRSSHDLTSAARAIIAWLTRLEVRWIFALAVALHLGALAVRDPAWTRTENLRAGFTLAQKGYLGDPFSAPTGPTAHVSPVYPVIIAAAYRVTGNERRAVTLLALLATLVAASSAALLVPVARRLDLPEGSGQLAALFWTPPLFAWIELSGEHETVLTTFAVLASLLAIVVVLGAGTTGARHGARSGALLGATAGIGVHFSPLLLPMIVAAAGARLLVQRATIRSLARFVPAFAAAFAIVVLPYTLRNRAAMGSTFLIRDNLGMELSVSNADNADPVADGNLRPGGTMAEHPFASGAAAGRLRAMGEVAYNRALLRRSLTWIGAHPARFAELTAQRLGYLLLPYSKRPYQRAIACALSLTFIFGVVRLWQLGEREAAATLVGAVVGYELIYLFIQHDIRYIYPMLWIHSLGAASLAVAAARLDAPARARSRAFARGLASGGRAS